MKKLKGAYSLVISSPRKLIGARDPFGFRPLVIGNGITVICLPAKPVHSMLLVQHLSGM